MQSDTKLVTKTELKTAERSTKIDDDKLTSRSRKVILQTSDRIILNNVVRIIKMLIIA